MDDNSKHDSEITLTKHASVRCQQRGITPDTVQIVYAYHVSDTRGGGRCRAIRLSRAQEAELIADGYSRKDIEAALRTTLIVSSEERAVTAYPSSRHKRSNSGRRFR